MKAILFTLIDNKFIRLIVIYTCYISIIFVSRVRPSDWQFWIINLILVIFGFFNYIHGFSEAEKTFDESLYKKIANDVRKQMRKELKK